MLLEAKNIQAGYGKKVVLKDISLHADRGDMVALIGHNGSAKTTTLRAIFGLLVPTEGMVRFKGVDVTVMQPFDKVHMGMAFVPQGRGIFPNLTVEENLLSGGVSLSDDKKVKKHLLEAIQIFPFLQERLKSPAQHLSGGEQQMLALSIALMLRPKLLLLDEPSVGLAPVMVQKVLEGIQQINHDRGTTMLIAEQNVRAALNIVKRVYVLKLGKVMLEDTPDAVSSRPIWDLF